MSRKLFATCTGLKTTRVEANEANNADRAVNQLHAGGAIACMGRKQVTPANPIEHLRQCSWSILGAVPNRGKQCFNFGEMIRSIPRMYPNLAAHSYVKLR